MLYLQGIGRHAEANLRNGDRGMAEHVAEADQILAVGEATHGQAVAQQVRAEPGMFTFSPNRSTAWVGECWSAANQARRIFRDPPGSSS